jgi:hypothetical protein
LKTRSFFLKRIFHLQNIPQKARSRILFGYLLSCELVNGDNQGLSAFAGGFAELAKPKIGSLHLSFKVKAFSRRCLDSGWDLKQLLSRDSNSRPSAALQAPMHLNYA